MRKTVAIGFVGTTLDYVGKGAQRWERWRPTVGLCQQDDMVIHRLELLHDAQPRPVRTTARGHRFRIARDRGA